MIDDIYDKIFNDNDDESPDVDDFFDPKYPDIKQGVKFTPIHRGDEYSVFIIKDAHPSFNKIAVQEIVYTWINGYYSRLNKIPFEVEMDRDVLYQSHSPACQGKKKVEKWYLR